ncbi:MAG: YncE family protein, partial [Streptosporangiaceae bacterium]
MKPEAAGLAVSADGHTLVVADFENDAITVLRGGPDGWAKSAELDLRPGKSDASQAGVAGGEYPYWVEIRGNDTAYISSVRDRQIVVVSLAGEAPAAPSVVARIALPGQPNKMILNRDGSRLYVAQDNADAVAVISTQSNRVLAEIPVVAPAGLFSDPRRLFGINPNSLALSPDEQTLYVTNGGENAVAVVRLAASGGAVEGLIPTGWYPNSVTVSRDGERLYVVNGMSDAGPNPGNVRGLTAAKHRAAAASNQYILQLDKAGFQTFPAPAGAVLAALTGQVLENDGYLDREAPEQDALFASLRRRIHHVIYIIKENRTYDQVLGDLKPGNGAAALAEFPEANTPNFHALARDFVTLDNFECAGEVSGDGWAWSTSGRTTDVDEKEIPPNYADRGLSYDTEGENRGVNLAAARRRDPDLLPGTANVAAPDGAG